MSVLRRIPFLPVLLLASSLSFTGCATIVSSQHRTEDYTPIFASASAGDVQTVKNAISEDPSIVNATEWDHATLLHDAVQQNHQALVKVLLDEGANVNALTDDRLTPLHMAAQNGNIPIARLLLEHQAATNPVDSKGWTPLDRAEKWEHPLTATFLKRFGGKEGSQP